MEITVQRGVSVFDVMDNERGVNVVAVVSEDAIRFTMRDGATLLLDATLPLHSVFALQEATVTIVQALRNWQRSTEPAPRFPSFWGGGGVPAGGNVPEGSVSALQAPVFRDEEVSREFDEYGNVVWPMEESE